MAGGPTANKLDSHSHSWQRPGARFWISIANHEGGEGRGEFVEEIGQRKIKFWGGEPTTGDQKLET